MKEQQQLSLLPDRQVLSYSICLGDVTLANLAEEALGDGFPAVQLLFSLILSDCHKTGSGREWMLSA
jgi:hypothetical protein